MVRLGWNVCLAASLSFTIAHNHGEPRFTSVTGNQSISMNMGALPWLQCFHWSTKDKIRQTWDSCNWSILGLNGSKALQGLAGERQSVSTFWERLSEKSTFNPWFCVTILMISNIIYNLQHEAANCAASWHCSSRAAWRHREPSIQTPQSAASKEVGSQMACEEVVRSQKEQCQTPKLKSQICHKCEAMPLRGTATAQVWPTLFPPGIIFEGWCEAPLRHQRAAARHPTLRRRTKERESRFHPGVDLLQQFIKG